MHLLFIVTRDEPDRTPDEVESMTMAEKYVAQRGGNYYVAGTRISLDSIVHAFRRCESRRGAASRSPRENYSRSGRASHDSYVLTIRFLADADLKHAIVIGVLRRDVGTMPVHFRAFRNSGKHSAGVFLTPRSLDVRTAIDELVLIWLASAPSEWEVRLEWLPL